MALSEVDARELVPGVELGPVIGRGGFAVVYRARQTSVDREVAVKIDSRTLDDDRNLRRFLREATAAARISGHPHVVSLYDCGLTRDDRPYLVMELCPNGSLAALLRRHGPLSPSDALDLGLAIAGALAAAHEAGILHRDVKPANVLIDAYGTPRLTDFGLAALPLGDLPMSVTLEALTPAFAAPESFDLVPPTRQSDVWSLGATLQAMIARESPRRAADGTPAPLSQVMARLADPLPAPDEPGYEPLMDIVRTATAYDPADRYPSAREMHDALRELRAPRDGDDPDGLLVGGPEATFVRLPAAPASPPAIARGRRWPSRLVAGAVGLAAGVGLTFGGVALTTDRPETIKPVAGPLTGSPPPSAPASDPPASSASPPAAPEEGGCWGNIASVTGRVTAKPVDCTQSHTWETYAVGQLAPSTPDPYESTARQDPVVVRTCTRAALTDYLAGADGSFVTEIIPPTELQFARGARGFACVVRPDGDWPRTGSLRDQ